MHAILALTMGKVRSFVMGVEPGGLHVAAVSK